ncbi:hypothetical protein V5799_018143 [Amblyomma americanum]|uniref:Uncharacterized protein n=1 Tax=Amblyomma americanum TaxID=6943 RepID=A0AAQ4F089_AMBAM
MKRTFTDTIKTIGPYVQEVAPDGVRYKAAVMLAQCTDLVNVTAPEDLQDLMNQLNLDVYTPPTNAPTEPDDLLALHVEPAYANGFSGLMRIQPRAWHSLSVDFNNQDWQEVLSLERDYKTQWTSSVPTSPRLVVGFPSFATTPESLDAYYETFLISQKSFLGNWLAAAEARRRRLSPDDDHLDALSMEVYVDTDGAVLVPAALFMVPFFLPDGPVAANVGGLGHVIAKALVER